MELFKKNIQVYSISLNPLCSRSVHLWEQFSLETKVLAISSNKLYEQKIRASLAFEAQRFYRVRKEVVADIGKMLPKICLG